jgi:hypothetical protein
VNPRSSSRYAERTGAQAPQMAYWRNIMIPKRVFALKASSPSGWWTSF